MKQMIALLALAAATALPVQATVLVPADLAELSRDALAIARGRVVAVEGRATSDRRRLETIVTLEAETYLKGSLGPTVQFRVPGGQVGRVRRVVVGAPQFVVGQRVVVFLGARGPGVPYVLGLSQGVFRVVAGAVGPMVTAPAAAAGPMTAGARRTVPRRSMALADFEREVRGLAVAAR